MCALVNYVAYAVSVTYVTDIKYEVWVMSDEVGVMYVTYKIYKRDIKC